MLWLSCLVSMVLSHTLAPTVLCPAHTARVPTLQTKRPQRQGLGHGRGCERRVGAWEQVAEGNGVSRAWAAQLRPRTGLHRGLVIVLQAGSLWAPFKASGAA